MKNKTGPFRAEQAEASSGFLLWQVVSLWQRGISRELAPLGLSHSQFVLLASLTWLRMHGSSVSQRELADHATMDAMTVSTVLRRLEATGHVQRKPHATDTRARDLRVTPKGKAAANKAVHAVEQFDETFFAALGVQRPAFAQGLMQLVKGNK
ncbi:MAG: MarR family transcriptional regulator [Flavobacteriales bacterium]|jgi:DNA-binding MarR family transcriptional regulator|nr:MarR family transcriptional regulator [Flavobacteriales bacterium]MBK6891978.1 MarR family transcriptional regulator [Flavobacteriales bacterium]MBK7246116.1 MarR family transcriptional regulator [Flavobacteriales bacterium]MBK9060116.1 MarR family transcriptional regulator [Flavobacteriales bacterium]MBK9598768.1 MarR family transcriptional regulator [Flavobacteriales bacterium]